MNQWNLLIPSGREAVAPKEPERHDESTSEEQAFTYCRAKDLWLLPKKFGPSSAISNCATKAKPSTKRKCVKICCGAIIDLPIFRARSCNFSEKKGFNYWLPVRIAADNYAKDFF